MGEQLPKSKVVKQRQGEAPLTGSSVQGSSEIGEDAATGVRAATVFYKKVTVRAGVKKLLQKLAEG